ncbi:hypothetical protein [Tropicibacter naphthalenivorans]|uniref:Lipoprotein n=1 Tax=Tropicibacter naphthalenivorans TaxID=441103 RepID=A0A0N7LYK1_9RHOB|nr:hypothetical protein [Tropicibacter naphthalenivorans]CUH75089.1 hypothetical protein TRN7648_00253 [Tropicibacter naphthalenivorans]SMC46787.1 hypothetical protein SAMN04488093_101627 [Tropicibacter naphthalenivorans]
MGFRSYVMAACAALSLAGCAGGSGSGPNATPEEAAAAAYRAGAPYTLTLYTMVNNRTDNGAHTSLMVNAPSQRVVFDPAGSVRFSSVPEVNDVLYGITPQVKQMYESAHARETYRVRIQEVKVSAEVAEQALNLVRSYGQVPPTQCTQSTSTVLGQLPGFESIKTVWYPNQLSKAFAQIPGVQTRVLRENDSDDKDLAIMQMEGAIRAQNGQ